VKIWIDGDACPNIIKDIIFKASKRTKIQATLVANQYIAIPKSPYHNLIVVSSGFDEADNYIVEHCKTNDIVITSDIPLAAEVMEKGASALNPRGTLYREETIKQKMKIRDFMDLYRESGEKTGVQAAYGQSEKQEFANKLYR